MIDLFKDGVQDTWKSLVGDAYGGQIPTGGYDFPTACILSKAHRQASDLHVEVLDYEIPDFDDDPDWVEFSEDPDLAPPIAAKERGPGHTRSPFKYLPGFEEPIGLFGRAYKPFGELVCILEAYGQDTSGLYNWFRDQWGIPDDVPLEKGIPTLVSKGNVAWAGISRTLKPYMGMLKATAPLLRVVHHGKHRTDFFDEALVDWERIGEVARMIAIQMVADDHVADKKVKRMDFRVVGFEIPHAPKKSDLEWDFKYERIHNEDYKLYSSFLLSLDNSERNLEVVSRRFKDALVEVDMEEEVPEKDILQNIVIEHVSEPVEFYWWEHGEEDVLPVKKGESVVKDRKFFFEGNLFTLVKSLLSLRYKKNPELFPRVAHLKWLGSALDKFGQRKVAQAEITKLIMDITGPNFLGVVKKVAEFVEKGRGVKFYREMAHLMGANNNDFQIRVPVQLYLLLTKRDTGRRWMLEQIQKVVGFHDHAMESPTIRDFMNETLVSGNPAIAVGSFVKRHRRIWGARFMREAKGRYREKDNGEEMVMEQFKAKVISKVALKITDRDESYYNANDVVKLLADTVQNYVRKRTPKHLNPPDVPLHEGEDPTVYARKLNVFVKNNVKKGRSKPVDFEDMYHVAIDCLEDFSLDVRKAFSTLLGNKRYEHVKKSLLGESDTEEPDVFEMSEEEESEEDEPIDIPSVSLKGKEVEESQPVPLGTGFDSEEDEFGEFDEGLDETQEDIFDAPKDQDNGDFLSDEEDFEVSPAVKSEFLTGLDLALELSEDIPNIPMDDIRRLIMKHGSRVSYADYVEICKEEKHKAQVRLVESFQKGLQAQNVQDEEDIL